MLNDVDLLLLFEEMLLSEKLSSSNTIRAYKSDIKSFIKYININYDFSISKVHSKHISDWLMSLSNNNINRNSYLRKLSSIKELISLIFLVSLMISKDIYLSLLALILIPLAALISKKLDKILPLKNVSFANKMILIGLHVTHLIWQHGKTPSK